MKKNWILSEHSFSLIYRLCPTVEMSVIIKLRIISG